MTAIGYLVVALSIFSIGGYHAAFFHRTKKTRGWIEVGKANARRAVWIDRMVARDMPRPPA